MIYFVFYEKIAFCITDFFVFQNDMKVIYNFCLNRGIIFRGEEKKLRKYLIICIVINSLTNNKKKYFSRLNYQ